MGEVARRQIGADHTGGVVRTGRCVTGRLLGGLRVAVVAPPWFELPPTGYGGIESIVADLVNELSDAGHEVSLVGAGPHRTRAARFFPVYRIPPSDRLGTPVPEVMQAAGAAAVLDGLDADVVHDHTLAGPLLARGRAVPTVVTMHGPVDRDLGDYYAALGTTMNLVAISQAQRACRPELNWVDVVHNAIDVASFPYQPDKGDYVLWLGRFCPDKAAHLAIDAAGAAGLPILLAGKRSEPAEHAYFEQEIRPRLGPGVTYLGEADATSKRRLLADARALLFPIQWEEPFGMVMIEALACGTPVVALRRGSVPEIIDNDRTGLIVDTPDQLSAALHAASRLDPADCRRAAETRFDLPVMAAGYERVYRTLLAQASASNRSKAAGDGGAVSLTTRRHTERTAPPPAAHHTASSTHSALTTVREPPPNS